VKLSSARNKAIPAPLRNGSGWYEEDCEAAIVGMYFPEAWPHWTREEFERSVKEWSPDAWEKATGGTIKQGEAAASDAAVGAAARKDDLAGPDAGEGAGDGCSRVAAQRGDEKADFLVPAGELRNREGRGIGQGYRLIIDPARHQRAEPKPEPV